MATIQQTPFEVADLVRMIKGVDPTALLVPARVLRRVIKHDHHVGGMGLLVPHRKSCIIARNSLLQVADRAELGFGPNDELPINII